MGILDVIDAIGTIPTLIEVAIWSFTSGRARSKRHPHTPRQNGAVEIRVRRDAGPTGVDAVNRLAVYGIRHGPGRARSDEYVFYVPLAQYEWALGLLKGAGLEITAGDNPAVKPIRPRYAWRDRR